MLLKNILKCGMDRKADSELQMPWVVGKNNDEIVLTGTSCINIYSQIIKTINN